MINKYLIIVVGGMILEIEMSRYYLTWDVFGLLCWPWWGLFILVSHYKINQKLYKVW